MQESKGFNVKTFVILFFIGMGYAITYAVPFVQYVFYDTTLHALDATNAQLGTLVAIFGIGNIAGAPIGGIISDKYNHKLVYLAGLFGTSMLSLLWAFNLNYGFSIFVFAGLAVTGLFLLFPAHIKIVRSLVDESKQGKVFGFAESFAGIGSTIVNAIALAVFAKYANEIFGFKAVLIFFSVCGVICTAILYYLIEDPKKEEKTEVAASKSSDKITLKDFFIVLKCPGTWFAGIAVFSTYTLYCSLSYFTPYFTNVLGVSVVFSGGLAIIRTYGLRFFLCPVGGYLGDKMNSVTKVLLFSWIACIGVILTIMFLPEHTAIGIAITLMLLLSSFVFTARGAMFAVPSEVQIPLKYAAITGGIVCAIGYSPDLFQFILFGNWIDTYGNEAYTMIFTYDIVMTVVGVISALLTFKYKKSLSKMVEKAA